MAGNALSDESMEAIISTFDSIYDEYNASVSEMQLLRSNCDMEIEKRKALHFTVQSLQSANERLTKLYAESLNKLADQIESRVSCQSLKEELKRVNDEHIIKEAEYRNTIEMLKKDYTTRVEELESRNREFQIQNLANEGTINSLRQDLAVHRSHIESLTRRLENVYVDMESKYHYEIQGLKDCLLVEQEEKNELSKKLQNLEKALVTSRTKLVEHQQEMTCSRHVEMLKQKIMKLRKENEVLKRQLPT